MTSSRPTVSSPAATTEQSVDFRMLSDHENRLHFFDRFAKDAPKLGAARLQRAG